LLYANRHWFYTDLAGLDQDDSSIMYNLLRLKPRRSAIQGMTSLQPVGTPGLTSANAGTVTVRGLAAVSWSFDAASNGTV